MNKTMALRLISEEHARAIEKFPPFRSPHEGLSIIQEEFEELKAEVYKQFDSRDKDKMWMEARQLAAMAMRFMIDMT